MELMNELRDLYSDFQSRSNAPQALQRRLSAPLLIHPTKRWVESDRKVLIVGQETKGWGAGGVNDGSKNEPRIYTFAEFLSQKNAVSALMDGYRRFEFGLEYGQKSPFWNAYRQIRRNFDESVSGIDSSVLWTNIFIVDVEEGSVFKNTSWEEFHHIQDLVRGMLTQQIQILKPDAIVFFTGPDYNIELEKEFDGLKLSEFNRHDISRSAWLNHESFGKASVIRTYHPSYLQRSNQWDVVDDIERHLMEQIAR